METTTLVFPEPAGLKDDRFALCLVAFAAWAVKLLLHGIDRYSYMSSSVGRHHDYTHATCLWDETQ